MGLAEVNSLFSTVIDIIGAIVLLIVVIALVMSRFSKKKRIEE